MTKDATRIVRECDLADLLNAVDTGVADAIKCITTQREDLVYLKEVITHMTKFIERKGYQVYYVDGIPAYYRKEKQSRLRKRRAVLRV